MFIIFLIYFIICTNLRACTIPSFKIIFDFKTNNNKIKVINHRIYVYDNNRA